jgi:transcriptional regulator with XRE-family HTH domain
MTLVEDANTNELNEITSSYLEEFQDKETRHIYVDEFLNAKIATQIKALREQRGWTQAELAEKASMKQERISVLEDVNYSAWTLNVLRRLAEAFDLRISLTFEDFGSFLSEFADFGRTALERKSFKDDPAFKAKRLTNVRPQTNKKVSTTTTPFRVVKPTKPAKTSTVPELPFRNLELVYSQPKTIAVGSGTSYITADEEDKAISTFNPFHYYATGTR